MKKIRPPFKIHGGKYYLHPWIIEKMPENYEKLDYLEPFCGAASVLINKNKSLGLETINDINPKVVSILRTLRDEPELFIKKIRNTTYSEKVFTRELNKNKEENKTDFEIALNEFIIRRMSRGGLGKNFSWSTRMRGGSPGDVNAWKTIPKELVKISERLQNVFILNKNALDVISAFNYENILLYVDPPYDPDSRVSKDAYEHEMTIDDHINLSNLLNRFKGKVMVSGYQSTLYKKNYSEWNCHKKKIANNSSQQKKKGIKVECLWTNF
jgi:DNA adenine methylase